ncbi:MAG TPA: cytochrome c oxidase subunit 3 [Candidatus Acidoferrales bacterium]|nr:cytochrome c oxidase subunit 3 [Candidatus Acidoferrales bacterium]
MADSAGTHALELTGGGRGSDGGVPFGNAEERGGPGGRPGTPQRTYATGMAVALSAILMFFVALVSAEIVRRGFPNDDWQPLDLPWRIVSLNTLILLASSVTLASSRRLLHARDEEGFRHWWGVTAILGLFFVAGQVIAWRQLAAAGAFLVTNPSSSFFYVFTAAHGLHLLGGIAGLLAVAFRPVRRLTLESATGVVAMYWHFLDGLWLFLFLFFLVAK